VRSDELCWPGYQGTRRLQVLITRPQVEDQTRTCGQAANALASITASSGLGPLLRDASPVMARGFGACSILSALAEATQIDPEALVGASEMAIADADATVRVGRRWKILLDGARLSANAGAGIAGLDQKRPARCCGVCSRTETTGWWPRPNGLQS